MKIENTLKNKQKFIAHYLEQRVLVFTNSVSGVIDVIDHITLEDVDNCYLQLTPLSQITDEDAVEVSEIAGLNPHKNTIEILIKYGIEFSNDDRIYADIFVYQYLQSKGYALPWMGLSVEELISYGWVKLKQNEND